jgi:hypothetical protein
MDGAANDYDPGIPGPSCTGYPAAGKDMVYRVEAVLGDVMDFTYLQQTADASFYIVTDCADSSGTCVAGADATVSGEPESIHYIAPSSATYYVILDSYGTDSGGPWTLDFNISWPPQACCFPDLHCEVLCSPECTAEGGTPMGGGTTCDTVVCENPSAARVTTWGRIRSSYR